MPCPANSLFILYLTTLSVSRDIQRWVVGRLANGGLESQGKIEMSPQGLKKTTRPLVKTADIMAEIRIEHLLNTSLERYDYTHLFGPSHVL
jgi:hypothetical protein